MRHKAFFYLFLFSLLILVLLYASNNNMYKVEEKKVAVAHKRIEVVRDSLRNVVANLQDAQYFTLGYNDDAQEYFDYKTIDADVKRIREEILALNHQPEGNSLVPYGVINGDKCIINKIEILNHRWIIADFYAGDIHGEILVKYFYSAEKPTEFKTLDTVLYPKK